MFDISQLVIERDVPIPPIHQDKRNPILGFLEKMEVGDSVVIPIGRKRLPTRVYRFAGKRFKSRRVTEETTRVWRIE